MVVEVQVAVKQRPPTQPEQRLMGRGLPTDRQVQNRIMREILQGAQRLLEELWPRVWGRVQGDLAAGRIEQPEDVMGVATRQTMLFDESSFWNDVADEWSEESGDWLSSTMPIVAEYQALRWRFIVNMRRVNEQVLAYTEAKYIPDLIKLDGEMSMVNATREGVRGMIAQWQRGELPGGRGLNDLKMALQRLFEPDRAQRIAVTEATRVYSEGNRIAWMNAWKDPAMEQAFGITAMRWNTAADEFVCPICRPLNTRQVLLDRGFPVEGNIPPAHVSCRCWLTPVKNYNRAFHPPAVPSGPKGAMRRVKKPSARQVDAFRREMARAS